MTTRMMKTKKNNSSRDNTNRNSGVKTYNTKPHDVKKTISAINKTKRKTSDKQKTNNRKPRQHPEDDFLQEVKKYLHSIGVYPLGYDEKKMKAKPIGYYEKRWGGAYTTSGMPDLHIMIHGLSVDVELKAANGRPSDLQLVKVQRINDWGGIGLIVYPKDFDHLKSLLESIRK